jgi:hypothetical protein
VQDLFFLQTIAGALQRATPSARVRQRATTAENDGEFTFIVDVRAAPAYLIRLGLQRVWNKAACQTTPNAPSQ